MKFLSLVIFYLLSINLYANNSSIDLDVKTTESRKTQKKSSISKNIAFSYAVQFNGPSLSDEYQKGATYNRFKSGQDYKSDDLDSTGSFQLYHSFTLGYKITPSWKLYYSYTFQDDYNKDIKYNIYNKDGSIWKTQSRLSGLSYNNQRINLFGNNLYSNNYFFLMSNFFYEFPTTDISKAEGMTYGVGFQPLVGIFSYVPNLYHGLKASIQRNYYKNQEFETICGNTKCKYNTRYRTLKVNLGAYIGYNITDKLLIQSDLLFDWDKQGDQIEAENFNEFNANMDDVIEIGPRYFPNSNMSFGAKLQYSLNKLSSKYSALLVNFGVYI